MQILMQIVYTLLAAAALIGIKALDLPVLVTVLLVAATVILCMLLYSGVGFKKKSSNCSSS